MNLPSHIIQVNDNWFKNTKTNKFIHKDNIEVFLEKYWSFRSSISESYTKKINEKIAKRRWNNEK